jgi:hypothetical protein
MTKKNVEVLTYIIFAILAIINIILCMVLGKNPENQTLILPYLFIWIGYLTTFYILLSLAKKEAFFFGLIPIIIQLIQISMNISDDFNKIAYMTIAVEAFAYICYSSEYFKIFTHKNYVTKRDRRWEEKEKGKIVLEEQQAKRTNLKEEQYKKETPKETIYTQEKELYFKEANITVTMTYNIDNLISKGMLLSVGEITPNIHNSVDCKYFGNDDISSDGFIVCENHVIIEENWSKNYYFDIFDLESVAIELRYSNDGYSSHSLCIKLKDGTTGEYGYFSFEYEELDELVAYIKSINNEIKEYEKTAYESPTCIIGDKLTIIPCVNYKEGWPGENKEANVTKLDYSDIKNINVIDENEIELELANNHLIELYKMDENQKKKLLDKFNNNAN